MEKGEINMSKRIYFKILFMTLVFVLIFSNTLSLKVSANAQELQTEETIKILESLDQSSVEMPDGSILINEDKLKENLGNSEYYDEIYTELRNSNMLTTEKDSEVSTRAIDNRNPKWVAARDACAKEYISSELGIAVGAGIINAIYNKNWSSAIKQIGKLGLKVNVGGLLALYSHMNYVCIKEANSKHSIY